MWLESRRVELPARYTDPSDFLTLFLDCAALAPDAGGPDVLAAQVAQVGEQEEQAGLVRAVAGRLAVHRAVLKALVAATPKPVAKAARKRCSPGDRAGPAPLAGSGTRPQFWDRDEMAMTWLSVRVDLLSGSHTGELWPTPGRVLVVGPQHTFADLSTAIDDAFARWDRSHLYEFTLADGRRIGVPGDDWDAERVLDAARLKVTPTAALGTEFRYVFDLGDYWVHRCTLGPRKVDPRDALGILPDRPLPCFGWGSVPDQYGRRWDGDDGESPEPRPPADPDPMVSFDWPHVVSPGRPRLRGAELPALRSAALRADRAAVRELLGGKHPLALLQHAGDALLAVGVDGLEDLARDVEQRLRERRYDGDRELADMLACRLGGRAPMLRAVRADLDQVADLMGGNLEHDVGGWLDLETGECWPQAMLDVVEDELRPDIDGEPDRWLFVDCEGSRDRWQDRYDFAEGLRPGRLRDRLLDGLEGRGAFGRFSRALNDEPEVLEEWRAFSSERERGRARALIVSCGYLPLPS